MDSFQNDFSDCYKNFNKLQIYSEGNPGTFDTDPIN